MDFDNILPHVGEFGKYQKIMFCLLAIPATIIAVFTIFNMVFIAASPEHWCRIPELEEITELSEEEKINLSIPLELREGLLERSRCKMYDLNYTEVILNLPLGIIYENMTQVDCKYGWIYDRSIYRETLITQMDIVCEKSWMTALSGSMFYVGSLGGSLSFGYLGDKFGRRPAFFGMLIINIVFGIIASFPPNYVSYIIYRTIIGTTYPSIFQIPFIMALELISPEKRAQSGMVLCVIFSLSMMLLAGVAYSVKDWFHLSLISSVPFIALLSYWWFLPESPRWLLSCHRYKEAELIVQKIAACNKKKIPPNFLQTFQENQEKVAENKTPSPSLLDLLRYPNLRKKFLIISFGWIVNSIVYTGLSLGATLLGVNDYIAFAISGVVEVPAVLISWFAMEKIGRCWVICLTMLIGGCACVATAFLPPELIWVTVVLSNIGKFGITGSFAVIYVYGCELFPTVLRSLALATACFIASIGLISAPPLLSLSESHGRTIPVIVMGALSVAGGLSILFLPETLNTHLPQTIEEGENFGKHHKFLKSFSCHKKKEEHEKNGVCVVEEDTKDSPLIESTC